MYDRICIRKLECERMRDEMKRKRGEEGEGKKEERKKGRRDLTLYLGTLYSSSQT
jgi:hypothetical protein